MQQFPGKQALWAPLPAHFSSSASGTVCFCFLGMGSQWKARSKSHVIPLQGHGEQCASPQATTLQSPIVSSHQLPHALSDVDRLDLLGLEAEITGPDSRGLGG